MNDEAISDLRVRGGAGGVAAHRADRRTLAGLDAQLAQELGRLSADLHAQLLDPRVVRATVRAPRATGELLRALDGPHGLTALAATLGLRSRSATAAADAHAVADRTRTVLREVVSWLDGFALLPVARAVRSAWRAADVSVDLRRPAVHAHLDRTAWLTRHPEVLKDVIASAPGLITGLSLIAGPLAPLVPGAFTLTRRAAIREIASLFSDGNGFGVTPRHPTPENRLHPDLDRDPVAPPTGVADLLDNLVWRDRQSTTTEDLVDVQTLTTPEGRHSFVVSIPGTREFGLTRGDAGRSPNDMATSLHAIAGVTTNRERAVAAALHHAMATAGAGPDSPVLLVGHSQGGVIAAQAAADSGPGGSFDVRVTHVLTAGAPAALIDVPTHVQVLALENTYDLSTTTDGADNLDAPNCTTVTFDYQTGDIGHNHRMTGGYTLVAEAVDASTHPSVTAFLDSAAAFLRTPEGTTVTSQVYELDRLR